MVSKPSDAVSVAGLGAGAVYLNWVSTYGSAVVTTLAIVVALVTLAIRWTELLAARRKAKQTNNEVAGDGSSKRTKE